MNNILYNIQLPETQQPIYIIGAGGIVHDAHLPAYQLAGFTVAGIYDLDAAKAQALADKFSISKVYSSLDEMIADAGTDGIYDMALPGSVIEKVLPLLPNNAAVLIQKPMGENLEQAEKILEIARQKKLTAAINFQLRYSPPVMEARKMITEGLLGEVCDIEININVYTPWHLWSFLFTAPRVEILYHSIHYVDLVRSFWGNPEYIFARSTKHPLAKELTSVKSNIIMDYGDWKRANIITNHSHDFGLEKQHAYIKIEGTKGAIRIGLGVLMNYPQGVPGSFEYVLKEEGKEPVWQTRQIEGDWFPHAFIGSMAQVMRAKEGSIDTPDNSVEDCISTMYCVEAAYVADKARGIAL